MFKTGVKKEALKALEPALFMSTKKYRPALPSRCGSAYNPAQT